MHLGHLCFLFQELSLDFSLIFKFRVLFLIYLYLYLSILVLYIYIHIYIQILYNLYIIIYTDNIYKILALYWMCGWSNIFPFFGCHLLQMTVSFAMPINSRLLYFLFYQISWVWPYVEVGLWTIWSWILCRLIYMDLFYSFTCRHTAESGIFVQHNVFFF